MKKPTYHILVCNSYRTAGNSQGACNKLGAPEFVQYITEETADRGLDVAVPRRPASMSADINLFMVVHPNNYWYGGVTEEAIRRNSRCFGGRQACREILNK